MAAENSETSWTELKGGDLRQRQRGWAPRIDQAAPRTRKPRVRKPQVSRYTGIQSGLLSSIFNGRWEWVDAETTELDATTFNTVDLFAGCGGLTLGFEQAGFKSLLGVEMDPDAAATYARNFPDSFVWDKPIEDLGDDRLLEIVGDRQIHVLVAGFPCQGFSVAGQRDPNDVRNQLFHQVVRAARLLNPWFVVLENVPGVVTMAKGRIFESVREEFSKIGYPGMSTLVLESADYGVPQFRPRAIFVANRFDLTNPYPRPTHDVSEMVPIEAAIEDLKDLPRGAVPNHDWTYHSPDMASRLAEVEPGGSLYDSYTDAWKRQYRGVPSMTIKENHGGTHIHYELDRTLSAREMARLQTFPDDFEFEGRMKRAMFQIGNAVPPRLAMHVARAVRPSVVSLQRNLEI